MEWSPLIVGLTIAYFLVAAVTTFDIRLTQAKRTGGSTAGRAHLAGLGGPIRLDAMGNLFWCCCI